MRIILTLAVLVWSTISHSIESLDGFLVTALDERFKVISPEKFKTTMDVVIENKTLVRLVGKLVINNTINSNYFSIEPEKYQKVVINIKKNDRIHFYPLSPAFQEVELIVGNKTYEIPPKR
jgi:hypothetical protein